MYYIIGYILFSGKNFIQFYCLKIKKSLSLSSGIYAVFCKYKKINTWRVSLAIFCWIKNQKFKKSLWLYKEVGDSESVWNNISYRVWGQSYSNCAWIWTTINSPTVAISVSACSSTIARKVFIAPSAVYINIIADFIWFSPRSKSISC